MENNWRRTTQMGAIKQAITFGLAGGLMTIGTLMTPSHGAQLEKITAVGSSWPGHSPVWMAIKEGYFKDAGFDWTCRTISGSMDRVSVISSGDAKFGGMGAAAMLPAMAQGNKNFYWVGSHDAARTYSGIVAR